MTAISKIVKQFFPEQWKTIIVSRLTARRQEQFMSGLRRKIINYYRAQSEISDEQKEILSYLESHPVTVFPYTFRNKYSKDAIEVHRDHDNQLPYVMHKTKRLYFKKNYSDAMIKSLYYGLQLDQDENSPHRYLTPDFEVDSSDVIADIGAAEGNFSLANIERVKKVYLFESDPEWIEALEATFRPWRDKVMICNKYVSDSSDGHAISLDEFVKEHEDINFLKVDIEGAERQFLHGAQHFLQTANRLKMAICTYHKQGDEAEFTHLLQQAGFEVQPSKGYMIFYHDHTISAPYLRRGLLRVQKRN